MDSSSFNTIFGLLVTLDIILYFLFPSRRNRKKESPKRIFMGEYLVGLPKAVSPERKVSCEIAENDFVFSDHVCNELGRIPRDGVRGVIPNKMSYEVEI